MFQDASCLSKRKLKDTCIYFIVNLTFSQESAACGESSTTEVVGPTSEKLESGVCKSIEPQPQRDALEEDISQYLLLHHDYAAKPESEPKRMRRRKLKELRPKAQETAQNVVIPSVQTVENQEVLYGTYDEATNCITILVNGEPTPLTEQITEVVTTIPETTSRQLLSVPDVNTFKNPSSPSVSSDSSDCGYESYDSPHSAGEADVEMWDDRISELSELFPSLI